MIYLEEHSKGTNMRYEVHVDNYRGVFRYFKNTDEGEVEITKEEYEKGAAHDTKR